MDDTWVFLWAGFGGAIHSLMDYWASMHKADQDKPKTFIAKYSKPYFMPLIGGILAIAYNQSNKVGLNPLTSVALGYGIETFIYKLGEIVPAARSTTD